MAWLSSNDQAGAWPVNIHRQPSADISVIVEKLLRPARARTSACHFLYPRNGNVPKLKLPGYVCYGSKSGLATLMVSDWFFKIERSWRSEERCTAVLFGDVFVMAVYALDCKKDMDVYETFLFSVTKLYNGKDVEQELNNSILPATSMFNWDCCVQTGTISVISKRCMVPCAGKGVKEIMAVSRSCCGMEL